MASVGEPTNAPPCISLPVSIHLQRWLIVSMYPDSFSIKEPSYSLPGGFLQIQRPLGYSSIKERRFDG